MQPVSRRVAATACGHHHPLAPSSSFGWLPSAAASTNVYYPSTKKATRTARDDPRENSNSREQALLALFSSCFTMRELRQVHAQVVQSGFDQHVFVVGRIISFCSVSEAGSMDYAAGVFERVEQPDGFLWNTMIRGFGRTGRFMEAFLYYKRMRKDGKPADNFTYSFLLKICAQMAAAELGKQVHCCAVKRDLDSHVYVRNTLIHMYAMFRDITTARVLFEEIAEPDLVAWNTLIDGHVHCGAHGTAIDLFMRMLRSGVRPDDATMVVVMSACSELGAFDFGNWVHSLIRGSKLELIVAVSNSLVDMYAKCGAIDRALDVFEAMQERNVVSWNSMILGFAMHGNTELALQLFARMQEEWDDCIEPNDITFLGVLCACSHGGLVEQGKMYFNSMIRDYHITPTIRHYGCMIDLLGRAGLVREAYELIRGMPMDCNAVVWRTLLAACRVHGDLELGECVRRHLLELESDHSSDYVLLSHMYASSGRWQQMLNVRESMRGRGVQKPQPGNSLINFQAQ
ncbi:hypothetical protein Taro_024136 [Colocasia esculenta]|uniref:Pentatricopeptide repeat-containing protein n=1 Tax=Colocasia esculenta TaxID=4460 RepID=A0A843VGJ0_COLES|nr:hypothetical protein [Colocasia esculenta]